MAAPKKEDVDTRQSLELYMSRVAQCSITQSLTAIQELLKYEAKYWFQAPGDTATVTAIHSYNLAIDMLVAYVEQQQFQAFVMVFDKYRVTVKGIRACFRDNNRRPETPSIGHARNEASAHMRNICVKVLASLRGPSFARQVKDIKVDGAAVDAHFSSEVRETENLDPEDEDERAKSMFT